MDDVADQLDEWEEVIDLYTFASTANMKHLSYQVPHSNLQNQLTIVWLGGRVHCRDMIQFK